MKRTIPITRKAPITSIIATVLKNNLFALAEDAWVYTDDTGLLAISITYTVTENEVVFDIWMCDEDLKIVIDKVMDEIEI